MDKIVAFLIDDDLDDQRFFQMAIKRIPFYVQCEFANDGAEALVKLTAETKYTPDYIFIDINMPGMNGVECLNRIKKISRLSGVPLYMYSTSIDEAITRSCILLGAAGVISKVPSVASLRDMLLDIFLKERNEAE